MTERLYTLLEVSTEVLKSLKDSHATIERLTARNLLLERELGKRQLLADMRLQHQEFKTLGDPPEGEPHAFFRRQI